MLEKDIEEPTDFSQNIFQKDNLSSIKKNIKTENDLHFTIVIRFPNKKSFSFDIPQIWNTKKLISFIKSTFNSEFSKSNPSFIFKGNPLSPISETPLKEILNSNKINNILIILKNKNQNENSNENNENTLYLKTNKEVFKSDEFSKMEKNAINDYFKIFKKNSLNNFPLMSPAYNHRREQLTTNSQLEKLAAFEPVPLEDFPTRNYFQLNIIFKCFISFFAFGIYIKGFNFVLFLWVLIGYYWYCVTNVIDEFYKRKIQEIGISEEEYKRIKNEGFERINKLKKLSNSRGLFVIDNDIDNGGEIKNKEDKKDNSNIGKNNKTNIKNNIEEDLKDEKNDKEDLKDDNKNINEVTPLINDILTGNNLRGQNNNRINNLNNIFGDNNNNRINNLNNNINNINNSDNKIEEEKEEEEENRPETAIQIIYQIISVFFLSLVPVWCDEFEANNPIPVNNNNNNNNEDNEENDDNNGNNNNNDNINNINNINNENNNFNNINNINNYFNNEINDNNIHHTSTGTNQEDDSINNNKMTSSKVVNMSDDSSRDNRIYKLFKKDNQSTNENEYVFSENGGIDNLSMNSELYKQKREKEKEKEKDKDKEKEKEKQIFEEDEEYLIEKSEDKKND